jgi:hypothetical protein
MAGGRLFGLCFLAEVCRFRAPFPSEVGTTILIESQHLEMGVESISVHFLCKASLAAMGTKLDFAIIDFGPKGKQCIVNCSHDSPSLPPPLDLHLLHVRPLRLGLMVLHFLS